MKTFFKQLSVLFSRIINWFFPPNETLKDVDQFEHYHLDREPEVTESWFHPIQKQSIILKGRKWIYVIRDKHTNAVLAEISASTIKDAYHKIRKIHKQYFPTDTLTLIGYHMPKAVI
jgi:hypothetical protein